MHKPFAPLVLVAIILDGCGTPSEKPPDAATSSGPAGFIEPTGSTPSSAPIESAEALFYPIVDTGQGKCYDDGAEISCPPPGSAFFGQDAQYAGNPSRYRDNSDGTVTDLVTGLMWQQDPGEKMTYALAAAGESAFRLAGYDDWRLPSIKELYSLILFDGTDVSACGGTCSATPFLDARYFRFSYGDTAAGERVIDSQFASATTYTDTTMNGNETVFGVNFADGRIKGYPTGKTFFVLYVRGETRYGRNAFSDNGDGTVTDDATGLTWMQSDGGSAVDWKTALRYCEDLDFADADDWRLPNTKELHSIVDYSRSPSATQSPALDPLFHATAVTNEAGAADHPFYWTSTTHADSSGGGTQAVYIAFGRALGFMQGGWVDVHGAGAQRSDPKQGDPSAFPQGRGPQGDAVRILNYVRCVRGGTAAPAPRGNPGAARPTVSISSPGLPSNPPANQGQPDGSPPPEAVQACAAGASGSPCSFPASGGTVSGTCRWVQQQLACVPESPPA